MTLFYMFKKIEDRLNVVSEDNRKYQNDPNRISRDKTYNVQDEIYNYMGLKADELLQKKRLINSKI